MIVRIEYMSVPTSSELYFFNVLIYGLLHDFCLLCAETCGTQTCACSITHMHTKTLTPHMQKCTRCGPPDSVHTVRSDNPTPHCARTMHEHLQHTTALPLPHPQTHNHNNVTRYANNHVLARGGGDDFFFSAFGAALAALGAQTSNFSVHMALRVAAAKHEPRSRSPVQHTHTHIHRHSHTYTNIHS